MMKALSIRDPELRTDLFEGADAQVAITEKRVKYPSNMVMGKVVIPAGARTRSQYVVNADLAMFTVACSKGRLVVGPEHSTEKHDFEDRDFLYVDAGEIFSLANDSNQEATLVFSFVGANNVEDLRRIYVDPPTKGRPS